jgi:class 3 adenylate cyclase
VRAGVHAGEVEPAGEEFTGLTVHIGVRVTQRADPGEVLVSSIVKDLVAGSGITFTDRGTYTLRGLPGEWQLFAPDVSEASNPAL